MSDVLKYEIVDRVARLTLNRPESRNALNPELTERLIETLRAADADPGVKCILIQGEGEHFSAGGDVKGFGDRLALAPAQRSDLFERNLLVGNRLPKCLIDASKPVVVATRGAIAGAGLTLCLAADFVVCAESSYFIAAHVHVGLSLDCGLSGLMVATMGIKAAKRLALLGERVDAIQALALGMVTQIVPDDGLQAEVASLTRRLAAGPATAMRATKALLNAAAYPDFDAQLAQEVAHIAGCVATDDFRRGIEAVLARQRAQFA